MGKFASPENKGEGEIAVRKLGAGTYVAIIPSMKIDSFVVIQTPKGAKVKNLPKENDHGKFALVANGTYFDRKDGMLVPTGGIVSKDGPQWMFSFEVAAGLDLKRNDPKIIEKAAKESEWMSAFITLESPFIGGKEKIILRTKDLKKYFRREFGAALFDYRTYCLDKIKQMKSEGAGNDEIRRIEGKMRRLWLGTNYVRITSPSFEAGRMIVEDGRPTKEVIESKGAIATRRTAIAITDKGETLLFTTDKKLDQKGLAEYVIESARQIGKNIKTCFQTDGGTSQQAAVDGKAVKVKARPVANSLAVVVPKKNEK